MQEEKKKLYSLRSIALATYLGGPLAGGFLMRENFRAVGENDKANKTLIISIIATVLLFAGIFSVPEHIIDKIPNFLIPGIYTPILYGIAKELQGDFIEKHKSEGLAFFSGWKAAGIAIMAALINIVGIVAVVLAFPDKSLKEYDNLMTDFRVNEENTIGVYDRIYGETAAEYELIEELDNTVIPAWEENLRIVENANKIEGLSEDLIEQNNLLKEYSNLRIETFSLLRQAISENTASYGSKIDSLHLEIETVLEKLN